MVPGYASMVLPSHDPLEDPRMTDAVHGTQLEQALAIIDRGLGELQRRELVSSAEVADLLLDLRTVLTFVAVEPVEPAAVN